MRGHSSVLLTFLVVGAFLVEISLEEELKEESPTVLLVVNLKNSSKKGSLPKGQNVQQGKGILSSLALAPFNLVNDLVTNVDPIGAVTNLAGTLYGGIGSKLASKLGSLVGALQTELTDLTADEWNDVIALTNTPIDYRLYTHRQKSKKKFQIMPKNGSVDGTLWDKKAKVKVIVHGFSPDAVTEGKNSTQNLMGQLTIKNSYLEAGCKDNIIVADWTAYTRTINYLGAAASTRVAGADLAEFIVNLTKNGYIKTLKDVHIIGFSLGAHVSGIAGNVIQNLTNGDSVGRITGLDPAGPMFDTVDEKVPKDATNFLDSSDAAFVDIIHCNVGVKGFMIPTKLGAKAISGHADFYPNGASEQPDCSGKSYVPSFLSQLDFLDFAQYISCSHSRCWMLYAESINSKKYQACRCKSWEKFKNGECDCFDDEDKIYMGDLCSTKARGTYFLKAEIEKPYNETYVE